MKPAYQSRLKNHTVIVPQVTKKSLFVRYCPKPADFCILLLISSQIFLYRTMTVLGDSMFVLSRENNNKKHEHDTEHYEQTKFQYP